MPSLLTPAQKNSHRLKLLKESAFYSFRPRPDQPERNDQQTAFMNSQHGGLTVLLGGNGCLAAEQEIFDPLLNVTRKVSEINEDFHVYARGDDGFPVITKACKPVICGRERLYEVCLSSGKSFRVTMDHRVYTLNGWKKIRDTENEVIPAWTPEMPDVSVVSVTFLREDEYWDFHVPQYENYLLAGVWHHNSGKSALAVKKAVNFMIKNDPPRPDTPFWMVSDTFESTMTTVWVEKLYDKGHLPKQCVDWERIRWYKPNSNWPYEVPLKKTKKSGYRNNWSIVMKSFDMGRRKFQGQSIGGFMFTEQFEHALLVESMRGCREKAFEHFKGNKICEFTPIDPHLSLWLQEMEENGEVPDDWGIYRSNTECAAEAGHVSMDWYQNQFLPMIPQSMIPARTQGLWSGYEGLIYPSFNPEIHCISGDWTPPPGWYHRRMIDWGAGSHNAFVCLFACFDNQGNWVFYDEYYSNDVMYDTIGHLKRISDQHPWPKNSPYYGTTWADPTSADRMRIASRLSDYAPGYDPLNVQAAFNPVIEGIECVSSMLKVQPSIGGGIAGIPKLRIVKDNCPNLVREFRMYQWMDQSAGGINPTSARMEPKKINDHCMDSCRYGIASEMVHKGIAPSTIARQHSANRHGIQLSSSKFDRR